MQLVRSVAAIVNGGYVLEPYIVSEVLDADGNMVERNEKTVLRQVISQQTSETMRSLMEQVVTEGTASAAKTPGYRVGGKTGTSEKLDEYDEDGNQVKDKIVSFIGVAPIDDPKYVVLVALDTPAYSQDSEKYTLHGMYISGGLMAAPTVRDIFLDILPYLGVEPDYDSEDIRGINFTVPDVIGMDESEAAALLAEKPSPTALSAPARPSPTSCPRRAARFPAIRRSSSTWARKSSRRLSRCRISSAALSRTLTIWLQTPAFTCRPRAPTARTFTCLRPIRTSNPEQRLTEVLQLQ